MAQQGRFLMQRFQQYQASKTVLVWACAGCAIAATIVGCTWGGWVTGGSAQEMAATSAAEARQEMASVVCVDRLMAAQNAGVQLAALKEITSSYGQTKFVEEGGWAVVMPATDPVDRKASANDHKAASLCAEDLMKREAPPAGNAVQVNDGASVVQ